MGQDQADFVALLAVFATALAQLRFAMSVGFGRPFSAWSLGRLVEAVKETQREFDVINAGGVDGSKMSLKEANLDWNKE